MSYSPQYITGEPQFRQPTPSERDKIRTFLFLGMLFFFIAGLIMVLWGGSDTATYAYLSGLSEDELKDYFGQDYISATKAQLDLQVSTSLITGVVKLVFGAIGFVFGLMVKLKAMDPLEKGEYEEAGRFLNIFMIMGFIFGLFMAGFFIYKGKNMLKRTAHRVSSDGAQDYGQSVYSRPGEMSGEFRRCPVCNSMMTYNSTTRMWFCSSCNKYQ